MTVSFPLLVTSLLILGVLQSTVLAESSKTKKQVSAEITGETFLGDVGRETKISFKGNKCSIKSIGDIGKEGEAPKSFKILLTCGAKSQTLWDIEKRATGDFAFDDPRFEVLWAGDKDEDGKLDLEMELSPKYSCSKKVTFLSSKATSLQIVGIAGFPKAICGD